MVRLPGEPGFPARQAPAPEQPNVVLVPVVGRISAGQPILAAESAEGYLPLPTDLVGRQEGLFILEVVGDSMIGAGSSRGTGW